MVTRSWACVLREDGRVYSGRLNINGPVVTGSWACVLREDGRVYSGPLNINGEELGVRS